MDEQEIKNTEAEAAPDNPVEAAPEETVLNGDGGDAAGKTKEEKTEEEKTEAEKTKAEKTETEKSGDKKKKRKKKKKSAGQLAAAFFIKLGVTALVLYILLGYVVAIYVNHSHASYPMIKDGDFCLVYRLGEVVEGEEVAYKKNGEIKFGRIVARGGDVVDIKGDVLMVNGYNVTTDVVYPTTSEGSKIEFPYKVPAGSYFILNDFRAEITDSREFGAVKKSEIKGKVIFIMRRRGI